MELLVKEPKTKRGFETLNRICDSAKKLFFEKGYFNTSINDITDGANIAPGTFYIYFNDKLNLYKYLLLQFSYEIRKSISLATRDCKTRYEKEYNGLKTYLDFIKNNQTAYRIIWESQYVDAQSFRDYYENFAVRYSKGIVEAQKNNEVIDIDPMNISYVLMGISNFIGLKYVIFDNKDSYEDVVADVMKILENGLFIHK
ncbi:MAG: fadR [Haloplasmataceae bacterium]|jgi:AcrR family transcriptional regulator|nr:fadR [Haloplasmataceae bacterium]